MAENAPKMFEQVQGLQWQASESGLRPMADDRRTKKRLRMPRVSDRGHVHREEIAQIVRRSGRECRQHQQAQPHWEGLLRVQSRDVAMMEAFLKTIGSRVLALVLTLASASASLAAVEQSSTPDLALSPDSPQWLLAGQASVVDHQGRKCLYLDGATATVKDF